MNPMIEAALAAGEDATGLCTVRDAAKMLLAPASGHDMELVFEVEGRRVNVLVTVTSIDGRRVYSHRSPEF